MRNAMQSNKDKTLSKPKPKPKPKAKTDTAKTQTDPDPDPATSSSPMPDQPPHPPPPEPALTVDRRTPHSCLASWAIPYSSKLKRKSKKTLYSPYFEVGGFDFRFLLYPTAADSSGSPGCLSLYIQINDPLCSSKFECFASYKLTILNHEDKSKSFTRESYYRFSSKKKTIGWGEFGLARSILHPKSGFINNDALLVSAEISVLDESASFARDGSNSNEVEHSKLSSLCCDSVVLQGKFTWKVKNFSLFEETIKTQKLVSSGFQLGEVGARLNLYQTKVNGVEYLSLFLEASVAHMCAKCVAFEMSSWSLFRISVLNQRPGLDHRHRDSYGRLSWGISSGADTSLGWTDFMKMSDFIGSENGFVVDDSMVLTVSFNAIKDYNLSVSAGLRSSGATRKADTSMGKHCWKIENFTRLKDVLKKKKMKGVFAKSKKFQVGTHEFRLVVYPRGLSQTPLHLSMFLEVLDPRNATTDWSCFVSYRLTIMNHKMEDNSIVKQSQERFSKATKELGWSEFVTLSSLFDKDSGYVDQDTVVFATEVLILKETIKTQSSNKPFLEDGKRKSWSITWKVENFLSFKKILATGNIYSKYVQVDQLEFRIGVHVFSHTVYAYLERGPSVVNDPDKDFWVSYRMTVVNHKNPAKSFLKESSSLFTKSCTSCDLEFMKLSDMLEADAGFVMGEMATFVCEILDYCPWFDFSELEVLGDVTSSELHETTHTGTCEVMRKQNASPPQQFLATARNHFNVEDNTSLILVMLKEELKEDFGTLARVLVAMRLYLDGPVKLKNFLCPFSCIDTGQIDIHSDIFSSKQLASPTEKYFLCQKFDNTLLDVMVECCQRRNRKPDEDPCDASAKPCLDTNEASFQSKFPWQIRVTNFFRSFKYERFFRTGDCMENGSNRSEKPILGQHDSSSESSDRILEFIVNSLKDLKGDVAQDPSEPRQGYQSVEKILLLLNEAPKHLLPDLVSLLPKLAYQFEHRVVACALLDHLRKPGAESSMRLPLLEAMCRLHFEVDVWERVFFQASEILDGLNGEALGKAIRLLFKAASQCYNIPQAVYIVRERLENLGAEVSLDVLDLLSKTLNSSSDFAITMLQEIDFIFSLDQQHLANIRSLSSSENELATMSSRAEDHLFSDIFMLLEMLAIPSMAVETAQAFEKGITNGFIMDHSVEVVLEKCASILGVNVVSFQNHQSGDTKTEGKDRMDFLHNKEVFKLVFGLADKLLQSKHSRVHGFLRKFFLIIFRLFPDENLHKKMLRRLIDHAMEAANGFSESSLDVLVFLVRECEVARLVLSMIINDFQVVKADRSVLQCQLRAREDENICAEKELQTELSRLRIENVNLLERLHESEAAILQYKSEMRLQMDRLAEEKKELSEEVQAVNHQFQNICAEQKDKLVKFEKEKKVYHDHLHGLEMQLSQLKTQKNQELKEVVQEKNVLSKRLRSVEAKRKSLDEELRRCSLQVVHQNAIQQSLLDEVEQVKQKLGVIERERRAKEEEVAQYKTYNDELKVELDTKQQYIHSLETSLEEEMLQHAPLYGYGLEDMSMKELETLLGFHEESIKKIHAVQNRLRADT